MGADFPGTRYVRSGGGATYAFGTEWTACAWWLSDTLDSFETILNMAIDGADGLMQNSGTTLNIWNGGETAVASGLSTGTWYFSAITNNGAFKGWNRQAGSTVFSTATDTAITDTDMDVEFGGNTDFGTGESLEGHMCACKAWSAELTEAELMAESFQMRPVRMADLEVWLPMWDAASLLNNMAPGALGMESFAEVGTGSFTNRAGGPPIGYGASTSRKVFIAGAAPPSGLDIPIAMHHYKQMMGVN